MFRHCGILECSDSVVFILECSDSGILECSDSVVFFVFLFYFRAIPTVWYFGMFRQCGILECSDSVVF